MSITYTEGNVTDELAKFEIEVKYSETRICSWEKKEKYKEIQMFLEGTGAVSHRMTIDIEDKQNIKYIKSQKAHEWWNSWILLDLSDQEHNLKCINIKRHDIQGRPS